MSDMPPGSILVQYLLGPLYGISSLVSDPFYSICRWRQLPTHWMLAMAAFVLFWLSVWYFIVAVHKSLGNKKKKN